MFIQFHRPFVQIPVVHVNIWPNFVCSKWNVPSSTHWKNYAILWRNFYVLLFFKLPPILGRILKHPKNFVNDHRMRIILIHRSN